MDRTLSETELLTGEIKTLEIYRVIHFV